MFDLRGQLGELSRNHCDSNLAWFLVYDMILWRRSLAGWLPSIIGDKDAWKVDWSLNFKVFLAAEILVFCLPGEEQQCSEGSSGDMMTCESELKSQRAKKCIHTYILESTSSLWHAWVRTIFVIVYSMNHIVVVDKKLFKYIWIECHCKWLMYCMYDDYFFLGHSMVRSASSCWNGKTKRGWKLKRFEWHLGWTPVEKNTATDKMITQPKLLGLSPMHNHIA